LQLRSESFPALFSALADPATTASSRAKLGNVVSTMNKPVYNPSPENQLLPSQVAVLAKKMNISLAQARALAADNPNFRQVAGGVIRVQQQDVVALLAHTFDNDDELLEHTIEYCEKTGLDLAKLLSGPAGAESLKRRPVGCGYWCAICETLEVFHYGHDVVGL
jgi:hypothetical protein